MRLPFLNRPPAEPRPASHRSSGPAEHRPGPERSGLDARSGEGSRHPDPAAERRPADRRGGRTRSAQDAVQARTRRAQYGALMRNLPVSLGGMLVLATATVLVSQGKIDQALMLGWLIALATFGLAGMQAAWRWRQTEADQRRVSASQLRLVSGLAGVVGALWGSLPALLFLRAETGAHALVAPLLIGVLGGGCVTLAALPPALASFAATLSAGTLLMLSLSSDDSARYTLLAWVVFVAMGATSALAYARELVARSLAEVRNEDQQQLIGLLLRDFEDHSADLLWDVDTTGQFIQPSNALADALGLTRTELEGQTLREIVLRLQVGLPETEHAAARLLDQRLTEGRPFRDVLLPLMIGGEACWWSVTAKPLSDERGTAQGWRGVMRDVTQTRAADRKLNWLATVDPLTGLANRTHFRLQLEQAVSAAGSQGALVCLNLDNFKAINDSLGHAAGDALLVEVGKRLKAALGTHDHLARLGSDEFAVLLQRRAQPEEVRQGAGRLLAVFETPFELGLAGERQAVDLRASLGVARYPHDGVVVDELMRHASLALREAKTQPQARIRLFDASLGEQVRRRQVLERDLRLAIEQGQIELAFQPKVDLARWQVTGFEALARWHHPQHGAIPPLEFVHLAEEAGLIQPLGVWVLNEACKAAAHWPADLALSVNLSAVQLEARNLPQVVADALKSAHLAARRLELDITEAVFARDPGAAVDRLHALKKLGCQVALDDFGAGQSSLAHLRRFPFDTLKIDRAFTRELLISRDARAMVRNILAMARSLRMATVAEGVEEPAQIKLLDGEGCGAVQGYYLAKPMPGGEIERFLIGWRTDRKPVSRSRGCGASGPAPLEARHAVASATPAARSASTRSATQAAAPAAGSAPRSSSRSPATSPSVAATKSAGGS